MGNGVIICVDGISNSGKTTLCKRISQENGYVYIKECTEDINCPTPSKTLDEELSNQKFYFELESIRMKRAKELCSIGLNVVLDRSPLSIVAVAYAFEKIGKYNCFDSAKTQFLELMEHSQKPDTFVFLKADHLSVDKRNFGKNLSSDWIAEAFSSLQVKFFDKVAATLHGSTVINTSNKTIEEICKQIIQHTNSLDRNHQQIVRPYRSKQTRIALFSRQLAGVFNEQNEYTL